MSLAVARAIDELKRGRPVTIDGLNILSIELADDASLGQFEAGRAPADLLVTHQRAALLHLVNQLPAAADAPVRIVRRPWMDISNTRAVADPVRDLATPLKGPYDTTNIAKFAPATAAIRLAKLAGLLPALYVAEGTPDADWLTVAADAVLAYSEPRDLRLVTRARLPLEAAENTEVVAFRDAAGGGPEHLALVIGDPPRDRPVLVRLHSSCLTGDVLGSLKCDCGPQLRAALDAIAREGSGILLYLQQEGRGIGLVNKLRAYALQDQGFDTVDANLRLGFEVDERDFGLAARMLELLGVQSVRLMTNNPSKVATLEAEGVKVVERVAHHFGEGAHNSAYLATKRERTGHLL